MTLQVHPIALGCMLVVAVGTLIYTYVTTRQQAQQQGYGGRQHDIFDEPSSLGTSRASSWSSIPEAGGQSSRRKREYDKCTICLGPLKLNLKTLTCQHVFHSHCITTWFKTRTNCPICRKEAQI